MEQHEGFYIPPGDAALVVNQAGELHLVLPKTPDDAIVPPHVIALTAAAAYFISHQDEVHDWFEAQRKA